LGHKTHVSEITESAAVASGYASALLAAMLKSKESVESNAGGVVSTREVCANHPTFLMWLIVLLK